MAQISKMSKLSEMNEISKNIDRKINVLNRNIDIIDEDNYFALYHYNDTCDLNDHKETRKVKGVVVDKKTGYEVCRSYSETPLIVSGDIEKYDFYEDIDNCTCVLTGDITLIRAFYNKYDGQWMFSSHKKLDAKKSFWGYRNDKLGYENRNFYELLLRCFNKCFIDIKAFNKKYCYNFIMSVKENRVVCLNNKDKVVCSDIFYHEQKGAKELVSLKNHDYDLFDTECKKINISTPILIKKNSSKELMSYINQLDYDYYAGILLTYKGYHYKIVSNKYYSLYNVRYNQNNIAFQFLYKLYEDVMYYDDISNYKKFLHGLCDGVKEFDDYADFIIKGASCSILFDRYPEYLPVFKYLIDKIDKTVTFIADNYHAVMNGYYFVSKELYFLFIKSKIYMNNSMVTNEKKKEKIYDVVLHTPARYLSSIIKEIERYIEEENIPEINAEYEKDFDHKKIINKWNKIKKENRSNKELDTKDDNKELDTKDDNKELDTKDDNKELDTKDDNKELDNKVDIKIVMSQFLPIYANVINTYCTLIHEYYSDNKTAKNDAKQLSSYAKRLSSYATDIHAMDIHAMINDNDELDDNKLVEIMNIITKISNKVNNKELDTKDDNKELDTKDDNKVLDTSEDIGNWQIQVPEMINIITKISNKDDNKELDTKDDNKELDTKDDNKELDTKDDNKELDTKDDNKELDTKDDNKELDTSEDIGNWQIQIPETDIDIELYKTSKSWSDYI